ncbi:efflux RND transporter periplasmic adaptor subunit [Ferrimonas sp.]|uniref:efflux RND transporter periplasmic adaptor subunit n=1 Tax=Ferrimonas sp. TaxID=2080861 RepID=UPI003A8CE5BE
MTIKQLVIAMAIATTPMMPLTAIAGGGHHHDEHAEPEEAKGPHGGKLVHTDGLDLEITVFERGTPPEMRIYAYLQGQPIDPGQVDLQVLLGRLGGRVDTLSFSPEKDYLVSNQTVVEPHSFDVSITAGYNGNSYSASYDSYEGRTEISDRILALSGVETETAGPQTLTFGNTLFGIVAPITHNQFSVSAPYDGIVDEVKVQVGDRVTQGQVLAMVRNSDTLQRYPVVSPGDGEVLEQLLNRGDHTNGSALVRLGDLSRVWVELSAFPTDMETLKTGLPVTVTDTHGDLSQLGNVSYIAPVMTGGHIARVRAQMDNSDGHWRPGMHVKARVQTRTREVPLAVKVDALQSFRDMPVVFARYGNTFEVRMVELGERDGDYIEVLGGLEPGTEYVTVNSYLMKADVLKDAAKHDH